MHCKQTIRQSQGGNQQVMLVLVASRDQILHCSWVGVEKLVAISFILHLEVFDIYIGLVADENIEKHKVTEPVDILVEGLAFVANL